MSRGLGLSPGHLQQEDGAPAHRACVQRGGELQGGVFIVKASDVTPDHPPLVRRDCRGSSPGCLTTQTGSASPRTQPGGSVRRGCTGIVPDTIRTITVRAITIVTTIVSISLIIDTRTSATITPSTSNISLILKMHFFHQNQNSDHSQALGSFTTVNISINFFYSVSKRLKCRCHKCNFLTL